MNYELNIDSDTCLDSGPLPTSDPPHGQWGSPPPASPATADPIDPAMDPPEPIDDDRDDLASTLREVRDHQRIDLAMLRLAFRQLMNKTDDEPDEPDERKKPPVKEVTGAEFNALVSAVVRLHDDERELFGIKPLEPKPDPDRLEYEKLKTLSLEQLIDLCHQERIVPPDTCQTKA